MCFKNNDVRKFNIDAFSNGHLSDMLLSEEACIKITAYISALQEEKARIEQEERARKEQKDKATERHKEFLSEMGMSYKGTISNSYKKHRVAYCYRCKNKLDNMINCRASYRLISFMNS